MESIISYAKKVIAFSTLLLVATPVFSQAYCSLRDPVAGIYKLFPEANNYRSIVETVDQTVRKQVSKRLPPNALHFGELGRHTLYVAMKDKQPLGFVHARSEESRWGLVEIAWGMDLQLKITDYTVQRCRSRSRKAIETLAFREQFFGKGYDDLIGMLNVDGMSMNPSVMMIPPGAEELANVVLRNGLKTLLVTDLVWREDISKIQSTAMAKKVFGKTYTATPVGEKLSAAAINEINTVLGANDVGINREKVGLYKVLDGAGSQKGVLYSGEHQLGEKAIHLWWAVSNDNKVFQVEAANGWPDHRTKALFSEIIDRSFSNTSECSNGAELMALEVLLTASPHLGQ